MNGDRSKFAQALAEAMEHHRAGRLREAETIYRQVLRQDPNCVDALHMLGALAGQVGQLDAAIGLVRQAIAIHGEYPEGLNNIGNALQRQGKLEEAIEHYRRAIALRPEYPDAHNNLGNALQKRGRVEESLGCYQRALAISPDYFEAIINLGNTYQVRNQAVEAIECYRKALALQGYHHGVWNNLGNAYQANGRIDEAIAALTKCLELRPDYADGHNNLANALKDAGRLDEAIAHWKRAVELHPPFHEADSNRIYTLHFHPAYDAAAILAEHRQWAAKHAAGFTASVRPHDNDRDPDRRIRIGYVSPDFREHSVGRFMLGVMEQHDPEKFEVACFSDVRGPDAITARFQTLAGQWHSIAGMRNDEAAEVVRNARIDILVDLTLHMAQNRMLLFARKPAPVQVTYLAYPGTSGLATMDYRLTDDQLDPPGDGDANYVETSVRLKSYWCHRPIREEIAVGPLPAETVGHVTFGCMNNFAKLSDAALAAWKRVLDAVPRSRIIISASTGQHRERVAGALGAERVEFVGLQLFDDYIRTFDRVDIALDPFPYCGGTTSCDGMWMGVPVVTLRGRTAVGRGGASLLKQIDRTEWVADDEAAYVRIARELAGDLPRLAEIRRGLRQRMQESPLRDAAAFVRDLEDKLRSMWRNWCAS